MAKIRRQEERKKERKRKEERRSVKCTAGCFSNVLVDDRSDDARAQ